jgi:hypothetical protein
MTGSGPNSGAGGNVRGGLPHPLPVRNIHERAPKPSHNLRTPDEAAWAPSGGLRRCTARASRPLPCNSMMGPKTPHSLAQFFPLVPAGLLLFGAWKHSGRPWNACPCTAE